MAGWSALDNRAIQTQSVANGVFPVGLGVLPPTSLQLVSEVDPATLDVFRSNLKRALLPYFEGDHVRVGDKGVGLKPAATPALSATALPLQRQQQWPQQQQQHVPHVVPAPRNTSTWFGGSGDVAGGGAGGGGGIAGGAAGGAGGGLGGGIATVGVGQSHSNAVSFGVGPGAMVGGVAHPVALASTSTVLDISRADSNLPPQAVAGSSDIRLLPEADIALSVAPDGKQYFYNPRTNARSWTRDELIESNHSFYSRVKSLPSTSNKTGPHGENRYFAWTSVDGRQFHSDWTLKDLYAKIHPQP